MAEWLRFKAGPYAATSPTSSVKTVETGGAVPRLRRAQAAFHCEQDISKFLCCVLLGSNSFTPPNRSVRSCSQPQRRDRRGRVPRLRNSQDDIGAGTPVQFSPVRLLQLQLQRRHSPPHGFWRQNRSERHPDWASPL